MRWIMILLLAGLTLSWEVSAQLRIIPQAKIDSVNNPRWLTSSGFRFKGGSKLDMGRMDEDGGSHRFVAQWQNSGDRTIAITHIKSSCSCLKGEFTPSGVKPTEQSSISISYNPKGHPGSVSQRLFIYTNLSEREPSAILELTGYVVAGADHRDHYPYAMGQLLLRVKQVTLKRGAVERIACMNSGSRELTISHDRLLTTQGISLRCEPATLKSGEEGDLVISFSKDLEPQGAALYIDGVILPPRERKILIKTE